MGVCVLWLIVVEVSVVYCCEFFVWVDIAIMGVCFVLFCLFLVLVLVVMVVSVEWSGGGGVDHHHHCHLVSPHTSAREFHYLEGFWFFLLHVEFTIRLLLLWVRVVFFDWVGAGGDSMSVVYCRFFLSLDGVQGREQQTPWKMSSTF
ncbi:hypothetical protein BDV95DRAFT_161035 [Massariosphaeria phaeospora]|uniref:Uncharacterized protein n=1 Tax=Massariosphaeria phaeospora TaxID=100035 RepID=A0A7C8MAJ0_9PLEO|nr:hypothetical protein BDV95DRAFT_161035 [Massariosphaeria phaeospora]